MFLDYDPKIAVARLRRADPILAQLIKRVGPFAMSTRPRLTLFQALLQSIVFQQLSGKAAGTIHSRLLSLFPKRRASPAGLLELSDMQLRGAGLSRAKAAAARDLATKTLDRTIPAQNKLVRLDDAGIIETLVQVRGIGPWTAEMLLIFHLGRADVLPITDLGVRKGFMLCQGSQTLPEPAELLRYGERWRPFRSVASWYLWRANDL